MGGGGHLTCNAPHNSPSELLVHDPHIAMLAFQMHVVAAMCSPCVSGTLVAMPLLRKRRAIGVRMMRVLGVPLVEEYGLNMHEARTPQFLVESCT